MDAFRTKAPEDDAVKVIEHSDLSSLSEKDRLSLVTFAIHSDRSRLANTIVKSETHLLLQKRDLSSDKGSFIHYAVFKRSLSCLKLFLDVVESNGIKLETLVTEVHQNNPLHLACETGNEPAIWEMLSRGYSIDKGLNMHKKLPRALVQSKELKANIAKYEAEMRRSKLINAIATSAEVPDSMPAVSGEAAKKSKKNRRKRSQTNADSTPESDFVEDEASGPFQIQSSAFELQLQQEAREMRKVQAIRRYVPQKKADEMEGYAWEIALAGAAMKSLELLDKEEKKAAIEKMKWLAQGNRSAMSEKRLEGTDAVVLFESYLLKGRRMIWQVEIDWSERIGGYTEIIRVWNIVKHDKVSSVMEYVNRRARLMDKNTKLRDRLIQKQMSGSNNSNKKTEDGLVIPKSFVNAVKDKEGTKNEKPEREASADGYILDKFYSFSSSLADSLMEESENREFPLRLGEEEVKIVQKETNVLLLGRSGTGMIDDNC